jgi:hypothetical protein
MAGPCRSAQLHPSRGRAGLAAQLGFGASARPASRQRGFGRRPETRPETALVARPGPPASQRSSLGSRDSERLGPVRTRGIDGGGRVSWPAHGRPRNPSCGRVQTRSLQTRAVLGEVPAVNPAENPAAESRGNPRPKKKGETRTENPVETPGGKSGRNFLRRKTRGEPRRKPGGIHRLISG